MTRLSKGVALLAGVTALYTAYIYVDSFRPTPPKNFSFVQTLLVFLFAGFVFVINGTSSLRPDKVISSPYARKALGWLFAAACLNFIVCVIIMLSHSAKPPRHEDGVFFYPHGEGREQISEAEYIWYRKVEQRLFAGHLLFFLVGESTLLWFSGTRARPEPRAIPPSHRTYGLIHGCLYAMLLVACAGIFVYLRISLGFMPITLLITGVAAIILFGGWQYGHGPLAIFVMFAAVAYFTAGSDLISQWNGVKTLEWHKTTGGRDSSSIQAVRIPTNRRDTYYLPSITYTFAVAGDTYRNSQIYVMPSPPPHEFTDSSLADSYLRLLSRADTLDVYYDPSNPRNAVLIRGPSKRAATNSAMTITFLAVCVYALLIYAMRQLLFRRASAVELSIPPPPPSAIDIESTVSQFQLEEAIRRPPVIVMNTSTPSRLLVIYKMSFIQALLRAAGISVAATIAMTLLFTFLPGLRSVLGNAIGYFFPTLTVAITAIVYCFEKRITLDRAPWNSSEGLFLGPWELKRMLDLPLTQPHVEIRESYVDSISELDQIDAKCRAYLVSYEVLVACRDSQPTVSIATFHRLTPAVTFGESLATFVGSHPTTILNNNLPDLLKEARS
jgi:hypothetical protein